MQLLHAIPKSWKNDLSDVKENINNVVFQEYHLIRKHYIYFLNRLSSKKIYNFFISKKEEATSSGIHYQQKFNDSNLDWKKIYLLVRIATKDSKLPAFQIKLLNNVLCLDKKHFQIW